MFRFLEIDIFFKRVAISCIFRSIGHNCIREAPLPWSANFAVALVIPAMFVPYSVSITERLKKLHAAFLFLAFALSVAGAIADEPERAADPQNIADLQLLQDKIQAAIKKVVPTVVAIDGGGSMASGVIVSEDGIVMTAAHVMGKANRPVTFTFADGKKAKGITLGSYRAIDAGLMKITDPGKWPFIERGRSADKSLGTWCIAMGHPMGFQEGRPPVARIGRFLAKQGLFLQTDCPIVGGDSGGPLIDLEGKLIGINSRIDESLEINLHTPVDLFVHNWDRMLKGDVWSVDSSNRDNTKVKAAFRDAVKPAEKCIVRVKCNGRNAALGAIVDSDGWIVTKASEMRGNIVCQYDDGREWKATLAGKNDANDLALLKIDARNLPTLPWSDKPPEEGQWAVSCGIHDFDVEPGIVAQARRKVPPTPGMLGIQLDESQNDAARIDLVFPLTPAEKVGLKSRDLILQINDDAVAKLDDIRLLLQKYRAGETIRLKIKRDDKESTVKVQLARLRSPTMQFYEAMNSLGVGTSKRSDDFPAGFTTRRRLAPERLRRTPRRSRRQSDRHQHRPCREERNVRPSLRRRSDVDRGAENRFSRCCSRPRKESGRRTRKKDRARKKIRGRY